MRNKKPAGEGNLWLVRTGDYLGRRLESAEPASCFVVLLVLELVSAFEALEATFEDVLTEFFAMPFHLLTSWRTEAARDRRTRKRVEGAGPLRLYANRKSFKNQ